jgi:hypothetical protein
MTTFRGRWSGDDISGIFVTQLQGRLESAHGTWTVKRRRAEHQPR